MTAALCELAAALDEVLAVDGIADYCPNGLQVEGRGKIRRLVSGVTASLELLEQAVQWQADAILVHHGYFWKSENPCVVGMKRKRLSLLLEHEISLLAYHLPLDVHPEFGNNVQLARVLGLQVEGPLPGAGAMGLIGSLTAPMSPHAFAYRLEQTLERQPLLVEGPAMIRRVAWCSGGGQGYIDQAAAAGVDLFLTGECSEQTFHSARENGISFIAAGHHVTERYGVQALGEYVASRFSLEHRFIDCYNPI